MSSQYIPQKYINTADALDAQGISEEIQKTMSAEERKRYADWVREANNKVETNLFEYSDVIPLVKGTPIFTYSKDAALNWVRYKQRNRIGSPNAKDSKQDFKDNIDEAKKLLAKTPTKRQEPIQEPETTDFGDQYQLGYSQTQGYPPDLLF